MKIGIPKGLLYCNYSTMFISFFKKLGAEVVTSSDTNKYILDRGVKYCVDEACLPVKIFHGHVDSIKDKCDAIVIPRFMRVRDNEFICPKFCGLPEMIKNSVPDLPSLITPPIYANSRNKLFDEFKSMGRIVVKDKFKIKEAYNFALDEQRKFKIGINDSSKNFKIKVGLIGHPYNIYDKFTNMNVVKKLNKLNVGVITGEFIKENFIDEKVKELFKRPFWTFARNIYGRSVYLAESNQIDGIVYISSFACGIDSVVIDLVKDRLGDFPFLVLKIDEHTGEAGVDTRLEAFADMLERRNSIGYNFSTSREHLFCG